MKDLPRFEPLEDRIVLDGEAQVTVDGPADIQLGAQNVDFTLTFDNVDPNDTGYVPFIDVILPTTGPDGDDGVTFDGATFLGGPIATTQIVFDVNGEALHPVAVDAFGDPLVVSGTPGDTLVVFELPFGSFSPGNPPVDVVMTLDFSDQADLSTDFALQTRGGFALGNDPLDNPTTDPSTFSAFSTTTVDQTLFTLSKTNNAPEEEAATGPSFVYQYTLMVDVAPGQTLTNFNLIDTLPPEIVYLGGLSAPGGTVNVEPTVGAPAGPGNNTLDITFGAITGSTVVTFDYFIGESAAGSSDPLLPVNDGAPQPVTNSVTGTGFWDPLDSDDPIEAVSATATNELEAASLVVQKSSVAVVDTELPGVPSPGDVYQFTLNVQVSDYFTFGDLEITDILGNGWEYVNASGFTPTLTTTESSGGAVTGEDLSANEVATFNSATGETTVVWDISQALLDAGSDAFLTGDDADGTPGGASTTATITYFARIIDELTDDGSIGEIAFTQGDLLNNAAEITATVRENGNPTTILGSQSDDSATTIQTPFGQLESKTITAINGVAPTPGLPIAAGDVVTFSLIYTAPLGSFEQLEIIDNLPQNVFSSAEITTFNNVISGTPPAAGQAQFGLASQAYLDAGGGVPTISGVPNDNQINFDFGTFTADPREAVQIEILFTTTVTDAIFADGLLLTNQATAIEDSVVSGTVDTTAIANFIYSQPELEITKGVVAADSADPSAAFDAATGPVTFTAPGSAGARFGGTITSDDLDVTPIDANVSNIDAGDTVTFAIVVENTGSAPNGAFDIVIADTLPPGFVIPASGLNLSVTDGTGAAISFTGDLFAGGITLDDGATEGALSTFSGTSGENLVVVTYDLTAAQSVTPNDVITNTAEVTNFTAFNSTLANPAINRAMDLSDDASAEVADVVIDKVLVGREFGEQGPNEVLVGEEFTFEVTIELPEGTYDNAVISDTVRTGGAFGDYEILSAVITGWDTGALAASTGVTLGTTGTVAGDGNSVSFNLGTLTNDDDNDTTNDTITFTVTARSLGSQSEDAGDRLVNTARFEADGVNVADSNGVNLIEPQLTIDKSATPSTVQAGETVNYTIVVDNPLGARDAPAFDLVLTDLLDPNVVLDAGSVVVTGGTGVTIVTGNGGGDTSIEITADRLSVNETITITYTAVVIPTAEAGIVIDNTADLTFDSLPTDDADDERDFAISDDADVTTAAASIDKAITATSNPDTTGANLSVGETVTYDITIVLPEGTNSNAVLTDLLPTTPGVLTPISAEVISIGGNISGSALIAGDMVTATGSNFVFNFGTLVNAVDLTQDALDVIVVRVVAQLDDLPANGRGDVLVNTARFTTNNTNVADTANVSVVEPLLGIDKAADVTSADAGDTVTYTITSTNSGNGPAYDIVIEDALADAALVAGSPAVASITILGGTPPSGADVPTVTYPTGTGGLQAVIPVLLPGQTIEIVFEAVVQDSVAFSDAVENTAQVTRYDTDPAGNTTDPDDGRVFTGPSDSVEIDTPDPSITKTLTGTDNPDTTGSEVGISEIVTYTIEIVLPEGTSDIRVIDDLPPGLTPISAVLTTFDASLTSDNLAQGDTDVSSGFITVGAAGGFVFDFGTVVNPGDNAGGNDTVVITVTAQVTDVSAVTSGAAITNEARLSLIDPVTGAVLRDPDTGLPQTFTDDATATAVEPELNIDKTVAPATADAGDTVTYTIVSENVGTGPAYDIIINDPLDDAGLDIPSPAVGSIAIFNGATDVTPGGADAPVLIYPTGADGLSASIPVLQPGERIVITFEAVLIDALTFSTLVENTAEVTRFDTDPDGNGTDADDGRVFDADLAGYIVPEDNAVVTTPDVTLAKAVVATSDGDTAGTLVGIGETITYTLTITVPQGTADLTLTDALPAGLTPVSAQVLSLGTGGNVATDLSIGDTDAVAGITLGASSVTFDFGTVTTPFTDNAAATTETIVVQVVARVLDVAGNADGTDLTNTGRLDVDDPVTGGPLQPDPTATATVEVVEPDLDISKTGPIAANPGDTIPYVVTVENTGTGPAHDVIFTDLLGDPQLTLTGTPVFTIGATPITPAVTLSGDGFTAVIGTLQPGETLTITYDAILSAAAPEAQSFPNTATVDYDTIADGDPATPDARSFSDSDDHAVATGPAVVKEATGSSLTQTGSSEFDGTDLDLVVGETVTYTLTLILPEVAMESVVLVDTLPAGLQFVSAAFGAQGAQITGASDVVITNAGQLTTFDFGAVDNTVDGTLDTGDQVTVTLTALVLDTGAAVDGASLVNSSALDVTAAGGIVLDTANDTASVDIVEPELAIEKTGPQAANAGDTVTYEIEIENTGTGPAFDILVADALSDVNLSLVSGTVSLAIGATPITPTVTEAGSGFTVLVPTLAPGEVLTITYDALLSATAPAAESFTNTATAVYDTVPDGDPNSPTGRTENVTDDHVVATGPALDKSIVSTADAGTGTGAGDPTLDDLSVGEQVTYELTLTLPELDLDGTVLTDTLPAGLTLVSAVVTSVGADISFAGPATITSIGQTTTVNFGASTSLGDGTINTDDQIVVTVVAVVADVAAATDGALLTNTSGLTITPAGGAPLNTVTDDATVEVVEPELSLEKDGVIAANPGETFAYTIEVTNTGTGPAYDILVEDTLGDPDLSLAGVTAATINGVSILGGLTINATGTGFNTTIPALNPGETLLITYNVTLDPGAPNAESFPNTATIDFDTVPDGNSATPGARTGSDSDDHIVATVPFLLKNTLFSSDPTTTDAAFDPTLPDLSIGEEITYILEIFLPEILLDSVVLTDTLPAGLTFVSASVVTIGGSLTPAAAPSITNVGQLITFDFGEVNNTANASLGNDDRITVEVTAVVNNDIGNTSGAVLTNDARLNVDPNGAGPFAEVQAEADVEVVLPVVAFEKTGPLAANPGDTVPYTISLENTGEGPAYDLLIADPLSDPNLSFVPGSVVVTVDGIPQTVSVTEATGFSLILPQLLPGQTAEVTFNAVLSAGVTPATTTFNTASITFDTVPDGDPNSPTGSTTTDSDDHGVATIPELSKTATGSNNPDTGTGAFDPTLIDLTIGEEVTYDLVLTLPEIDMDSVVLTDTLPAGLGFVSATITSTGAGITTGVLATSQVGQVVTLDLGAVSNPFDGSIGADDEITIQIIGVVLDDAAAFAGATLTNTAALTVTPAGGTPLNPQTDTATVEVVEPLPTVDKTVSDPSPTVGDTITYTVVVTNDASATAPIYNAVVSDPLPFQLSTTGAITVSDPTLATVTSGSAAGDTTLSISIPRLAPGESVTITYDVFIGFATDVLRGVTNVATIDGTSTPDATNPNNRDYTVSDPAEIVAQPLPDTDEDDDFFRNLGIDDALFLPVLAIDPIYSGTAEPGSNVTIRLYGPQGELTGVRNVLADAGGHWIAIFPRVDLEPVFDEMFTDLAGSRVFDRPVELLDQRPATQLAALGETRFAQVGTDLGTESYYISLSADRPSTLPQEAGMFNARNFYATAFSQEAFAVSDTLRVDEVFENIAGATVQNLYDASLNPLGQSLNRFNYEFLSGSTATPGSAY